MFIEILLRGVLKSQLDLHCLKRRIFELNLADGGNINIFMGSIILRAKQLVKEDSFDCEKARAAESRACFENHGVICLGKNYAGYSKD